MLVICTKTGLTYARKVYKEGEVFILAGRLEGEYKNLSNEAWARKQKRTYSGDVTFRRPTDEEIIAAIRDKKLDPGSAAIRGQLSKKQLRIAYDYAESKEAKKIKAIQMLKEGLDMEIEDAPEENAEIVEAPKKEAEAPPEKPVEEPKEPEAPEEEPKPEELVKEPEASEGTPEKEPEAPEKEPGKEASEKKDKK